ncbi:flagellar FlbD family protein [Sphingomonas sp.]|uniref:flagellar FlbD family protein n=1 Tax=Sphingomonas sp. TaxID=28214 RepID=UPI003B00CDF5
MIEFTAYRGGRVAVNPMLVFAIEAVPEGGTQIVSAAGGVVVVKEEFGEVHRRIGAWAKSG